MSVDDLSQRFHRCFESLEPDDDLFTDDAFFDLLPPLWRFQLQGGEAFTDQLRSIAVGPSEVDIIRTVPTATGFVTEHVERQRVDGDVVFARRLWLCEVRGGRIAEVIGYCNGGWDRALRERQAAEAPMLRA